MVHKSSKGKCLGNKFKSPKNIKKNSGSWYFEDGYYLISVMIVDYGN